MYKLMMIFGFIILLVWIEVNNISYFILVIPATIYLIIRFWSFFWKTTVTLTILVCLFFLGTTYFPLIQNFGAISVNDNNQIVITKDILSKLNGVLPEHIQNINFTLNDVGHKIDRTIDEKIDKLFEPVYGQIPKYADNHYSLLGSYDEALKTLTNDLEKNIYDKLFGTVNFNENYNDCTNNIFDIFSSKIDNAVNNIHENLKESLGLTDYQIKLFDKAIDYSIDEIKDRIMKSIFNTINSKYKIPKFVIHYKAFKNLVTKLVKKVFTRSAGGIIGKTVGGGVAGVAGAIMSDVIIIKLDEHFYRDEFESELRTMVSGIKEEIKYNLKDMYTQALQEQSEIIKYTYQNIQLNRNVIVE